MKSLISKVILGAVLTASMLTVAGPASATDQAPSGTEPGTVIPQMQAPAVGSTITTLEGDTVVVPEPRMQARAGIVCDGAEGALGTAICIDVNGGGTYVNWVYIYTYHPNTQQRCGVQSASWGTTPSGQPSVTRYSAFTYDCFWARTESGRIDMYRTFKHNTFLYGNQYYDGAWRGGVVGIRITS